ncbi:hypothetical protein V8E53_011543 [Lactarius tabidus]
MDMAYYPPPRPRVQSHLATPCKRAPSSDTRPAEVTIPSGFQPPPINFFFGYDSLYVHLFAHFMRSTNFLRISIHYEVTLKEMAAASLDVKFKEELMLSSNSRPVFFVTVSQLEQIVDFMPALLSPAVGGSLQSQMEAKFASMNLKSPGPHANLKAASNSSHRISAPALASSVAEWGTWVGVSSVGEVAERDNSPTQDISVEPRSSRPQSSDFSGLSGCPALRSPCSDDGSSFDGLSPTMGDSWASVVNTPLLPMFQKSSTLVNNIAINNGVYGDDGDLISGNTHLASVVSQVPLREEAVAACQAATITGPVHKVPHSRTPLAVLATPQLPVAQINVAGGRFGQADLAGLGLGGFGGLQSGMGGSRGPFRSGSHSPGLSANGKSGSSSAGNGSAKENKEDFDPAVLNDVAGWLLTLRLHKYTPNFEGISWKEMVIMGDQALQAQGIAALGARKKMGIGDPTAPPGGPSPSLASTLGSSAGSGGGMPLGVKYSFQLTGGYESLG